MSDWKGYRRLVNRLRRDVPPAFPVTVRRTKMKDLDGYCMKVRDRFVIHINRELDSRMATETLVHEWAHALRWDYKFDTLDVDEFHKRAHDASWGVCFAEVYRVYENVALGR